VHRPKYDDWSLPKGKREPGEHVLLTAAREVLEETSVRPVLGPRLRTVEYLVRGRPKQVDYWAALAAHDQAAASHEIDAVCWLPLPQVLDRLSYPHDAAVIASTGITMGWPVPSSRWMNIMISVSPRATATTTLTSRTYGAGTAPPSSLTGPAVRRPWPGRERSCGPPSQDQPVPPLPSTASGCACRAQRAQRARH